MDTVTEPQTGVNGGHCPENGLAIASEPPVT
jgi:hypothetical protein